jgi:hypothetical protein
VTDEPEHRSPFMDALPRREPTKLVTDEWGYERTRADDARHQRSPEQGVMRKHLAQLRERLGHLRGRPPAGYHQDWAARYLELHAQLHEYDDVDPVDGERPIGHLAICSLVASEDYAAHRGRWKYDPDGDDYNRKKAAQRISEAVKPLI